MKGDKIRYEKTTTWHADNDVEMPMQDLSPSCNG